MKKTSTWTFTRLERQLLFRVAREAQAASELIIASKFRFAEVVEALIFLTYFPSGSRQHKQLTTHLKEVAPAESMMDCIKRIAPDFYEEWEQSLMNDSGHCTKYDEVADQVWAMLAEYGIDTAFVQ